MKLVLPVTKHTILIFFSEILNLEVHLNCCIGLKLRAILLNGWILPTDGVALGKVCPAACGAGLFLEEFYLETSSFKRTRGVQVVLQQKQETVVDVILCMILTIFICMYQ